MDPNIKSWSVAADGCVLLNLGNSLCRSVEQLTGHIS